MFAGSTRAALQTHVGMGIEKACASVLGPNLVEVRLGGGFVVALCTHSGNLDKSQWGPGQVDLKPARDKNWSGVGLEN